MMMSIFTVVVAFATVFGGDGPTEQPVSKQAELTATPLANGQSTWTLSRNGNEIWRRSLPFVPADHVCLASGGVAAFGYETDEFGSPARAVDGHGRSNIYIAILSPKGDVLEFDVRERGEPGYGATPVPDAPPKVDGITVTSDEQEILVRANYWGLSEWWRYDATTGKPLGDAKPDPPAHARHYEDLKCVPVPKSRLVFLFRRVVTWRGHETTYVAVCSCDGRARWVMEHPLGKSGSLSSDLRAVAESIEVEETCVKFRWADDEGNYRVRFDSVRELVVAEYTKPDEAEQRSDPAHGASPER